MQRETYKTLVAALTDETRELMPWDLAQGYAAEPKPLLLDIRCPDEYEAAHIQDSINVPRGILEIAVDYGYEETVPELVEARNRKVIVLCRSGNRSVLAAHTLRLMGYTQVVSLRTGLRGWNDYEQPLVNEAGVLLDPDWLDDMFSAPIAPEKLGPVTASNSRRPGG